MVDTVPENAVGPSVESLKDVFGVQKVPLASNFSDLIDIADAGRKAAGLSPAQDGIPGDGLQLDSSGKLAVRPKADSGVRVDGSGVGVDFGTSLKVANGKLEVADSFAAPPATLANGTDFNTIVPPNYRIGVYAVPNDSTYPNRPATAAGLAGNAFLMMFSHGNQNSYDCTQIYFNAVGGMWLRAKHDMAAAFTAWGRVNAVVADPGKGITVNDNAVGVIANAASGIKVDSNGVGVTVEPNKGLSVGAAGVAVKLEANKGLVVGANGVGVDFGASLKVANGKLEVADSFAASSTSLANGTDFNTIVPPGYRVGVYGVENNWTYPNRPGPANNLEGNAFLMMFSHKNFDSSDCTQIYFNAVGGMWLRAKHDGAAAFTAWGRVNAVVADPGKGITVNDNVVGVNHGSSLAMVNGKLEVAQSAGIPSGLIVMFSGTVIPTGWALCDGSSGRPDLRNRFILGGSGGEVGAAGGSGLSGSGGNKAYNLPTSKASAVGITVTVGNTTLTVDQIPAHNHTGKFTWNTTPNAGGYTSFTQGNTPTPETRTLNNSTGGSQPHTHTGSATQGTHSHTLSTLPAYYILAFIIKL